jgi:hypothetical protein
VRAEASPLHPHEPDIPPTLDAEGRCLVCRALVEAEKRAYARAVSDVVEELRRWASAHHAVDFISQAAEHVENDEPLCWRDTEACDCLSCEEAEHGH